MPLVGAPTFAPGILTADQLNSLVSLLEQKFDGGIGTDDIGWPLSAGGNLDMVQHDILHLYKLWNVRNLAERDSSTTLQDVFDEVGGEGGGVILLPANNTETIGTSGVEVWPNTLVMGQGSTSVFATSGTLTNHMFHNKAAGDEGIKFVNLKATNEGASGGAFDIFGMTRVNQLQFVDVIMVVDRENGLSIETNSPGSSSFNVSYLRGNVTVQNGGDAGIYATDIDKLYIRGTDATVVSGPLVLYSASGAAARGQSMTVEQVTVTVDDAATSDAVFRFTAGSTNGMPGLRVSSNEINAGGSNIDFIIDVVETTSGPKIMHNDIYGDISAAAVRVQGSPSGLHVSSNCIDANAVGSGTGLGILIGGTARSGSVNGCTHFLVCDNILTAKESCLVLVHPGSGLNFSNSIVADNTANSQPAAPGIAEFEMWNLGSTTTTTYTFYLTIADNIADTSSTSYGWKNYSDMGVNQGGSAGVANDSRLIVLGNSIYGSDFAASGGDFFDTDTAAAKRYRHAYNQVV